MFATLTDHDVPAISPQWVILTGENVAIRFSSRYSTSIDFRVFDASETRYSDGKGGWSEARWELDDCGESWTLDDWEAAFWGIDGTIKWDGCIDWQTNPECMMHGCGPRYVEHVSAIFQAIYAFAKRHFDLLGDEVAPMPEPNLEIT